MTSPAQERLSVAAPGELIELVAYLLGFHPVESLTMIGLAQSRTQRAEGRALAAEGSYRGLQVQVAARIDLPEPASAAAEVGALLQAVLGAEADTVAVIVFTDALSGDPRDDQALGDLHRTLVRAARRAGVAVLDVLVTSADSWWSLRCRDVDCCPPSGSRRLGPSAVVAAQATFAGLPAWPDRESIEHQLDGDSTAQRDKMVPLMARAQRSGSGRAPAVPQAAQAFGRIARRLANEADPRAALSDQQLARLGCQLQSHPLRDELWMLIDEGSFEGSALLGQLLRRLPAPYDAPALFLFGWASWRGGNGTIAAMAARRALTSDPSYTAAHLLLDALGSGLHPHRTPPLRSTLSEPIAPPGPGR